MPSAPYPDPQLGMVHRRHRRPTLLHTTEMDRPTADTTTQHPAPITKRHQPPTSAPTRPETPQRHKAKCTSCDSQQKRRHPTAGAPSAGSELRLSPTLGARNKGWGRQAAPFQAPTRCRARLIVKAAPIPRVHPNRALTMRRGTLQCAPQHAPHQQNTKNRKNTPHHTNKTPTAEAKPRTTPKEHQTRKRPIKRDDLIRPPTSQPPTDPRPRPGSAINFGR
jgi:hypothetical protein